MHYWCGLWTTCTVDPDNSRYSLPEQETEFRLAGVSAMGYLRSVPVLFFAYVAHQNIPVLYLEWRDGAESRSENREALPADGTPKAAPLLQQVAEATPPNAAYWQKKR